MAPLAWASLISAVLTWAAQALAGRALGPGGYADFMVVWGLVFVLVAMQQGLQQEVNRSVTAARDDRSSDAGDGTSPLRVGALVGVIGAVLMVISSPWWGERVFGAGWAPLVLVAVVGFVGYALYNAVNGSLAGLQRWGDYAASIATEGVIRFVLVAGVLALGAGLVVQAWALVGAAASWVLLLVRPGFRAAIGARAAERDTVVLRGAGQAMVATTCSALVLAGFPVLLSITASGTLPVEAGVVLAAVVATRAPLLLPLNAFQAVLLSRFVSAGNRLVHDLSRLALVVAGVSVLGAGLAALTGPFLLRLLYGPSFQLGSLVLSLLVLSAGLLTIQSATGMAVLARGHHVAFAVSWIVSTSVVVALLALAAPVAERTVAALLAGPAVGILANVVTLGTSRTRGGRQPSTDPPAPTVELSSSGAGGRRRSRRRPGRTGSPARTVRLGVVVPVVVFLLLTLLGVTQSSIGVDTLRAQPADPQGVMLGTARPIRSDEFLTSGPTFLGVTATGSTDTLNPLAQQQGVFSGLPRGLVSSVVFPDSAALELGPWLPDAMLFAAKWWLPFLLLLLAGPAWFRRITGSRAVGWWATALIILSPSSAWWSFIHVQVLGFGLAGAVALQLAVGAARGSRWVVAVAWAAACALLLTRTAFTYQPWVVVLIPPILLATVVDLLTPAARRLLAGATIVLAGAATLVVLGAVVLENRAELATLTSTIYPGQRRATGMPNPLQDIFGATSLSPLADGAAVTGSNDSEISSSYAVALAWVAVLVAQGLEARRGQRLAIATFAAVTAFWFAWSTVSFGALGERVPLANLVPSQRAAEVLGYLAVVLVCLVLPRVRARPGWSAAAVSAVLVTALAANAGSLLRAANVASLSLSTIWISSIVTGLVVLVVTLAPRRPWGYVAGAIAASALVWNVNPVLVGTADLRTSSAARMMLADGDQARADGTVYATDSYGLDALLLATGVPSISGRQVSGPDAGAWRAFLPNVPEERWNRGAAFIWFQWTDQARLRVTNPADDVILVSGSPCTVAAHLPAVARIVSTHELSDSCLAPAGRFTWGGVPQWSYTTR